MNIDRIISILKLVEWCSEMEVYGDDGDPEPLGTMPACPLCHGFKEMPPVWLIGEVEIPIHPDTFDEVGHNADCELAKELEPYR